MRITLLPLLTLAALLTGCVVIPPITPGDLAELEAAGAEMRERMFFTYPRSSDERLQAYVDAIGQRLVKQMDATGQRYRFEVVIGDDLNAFALPGGYVFVTTEAFKAMKTEAQLAAVFGHVVAHVAAHHAWRGLHHDAQTRAMYRPRRNAGFLDLLWAALMSSASTSHYSREMEAEADRMGVDAAYAAGYDPRGLKEFFEILEQKHPSEGKGPLAGWFSTHPSSPERVAAIDARIAERGMELDRLKQGRAELRAQKQYSFPWSLGAD